MLSIILQELPQPDYENWVRIIPDALSAREESPVQNLQGLQHQPFKVVLPEFESGFHDPALLCSAYSSMSNFTY